MRKNASISEAQKLGSWQLATVATKQRGFKRAGLARDCADIVLEAMRTFELDSEMQAKGCLVLGWCFFKHTQVAREAQKEAADVAARAVTPGRVDAADVCGPRRPCLITCPEDDPGRARGVNATILQVGLRTGWSSHRSSRSRKRISRRTSR